MRGHSSIACHLCLLVDDIVLFTHVRIPVVTATCHHGLTINGKDLAMVPTNMFLKIFGLKESGDIRFWIEALGDVGQLVRLGKTIHKGVQFLDKFRNIVESVLQPLFGRSVFPAICGQSLAHFAGDESPLTARLWLLSK